MAPQTTALRGAASNRLLQFRRALRFPVMSPARAVIAEYASSSPRKPVMSYRGAVAVLFQLRREMFEATCSNCGREAQVPFRPTSGKPVYCSDCFRSMRG